MKLDTPKIECYGDPNNGDIAMTTTHTKEKMAGQRKRREVAAMFGIGQWVSASIEDQGVHGFLISITGASPIRVSDRNDALSRFGDMCAKMTDGATQVHVRDETTDDLGHLVVLDTEAGGRMCYSAGRMRIARADGAPFSVADIEAATRMVPVGQVRRIAGIVGDVVVTGVWECDSSG